MLGESNFAAKYLDTKVRKIRGSARVGCGIGDCFLLCSCEREKEGLLLPMIFEDRGLPV